MGQIESNVGTRLRALREQRGLSLRSLAEKCGLSFNTISLIERGENSPTVSSLHALALALDVKITDFFEESTEQAVVYVKRDQRLRSEGNGLIMESLGLGLRHQQLEPFLMTVDTSTGNADDLVSHSGQEFVYCLEGTLEYRIGSHCYELESGDSLLFEAGQPHCFQNAGTAPAVILIIFQAAEGSLISNRNFPINPHHSSASSVI
jgi:transcriptional regulator with XRE-family HTH domain